MLPISLFVSVLALSISLYSAYRSKPGEKGDKGDRGDRGDKGDKGDVGANGDNADIRNSRSVSVSDRPRFISKDERRQMIKDQESDPDIQVLSEEIRKRRRNNSGLIPVDKNAQKDLSEFRSRFSVNNNGE